MRPRDGPQIWKHRSYSGGGMTEFMHVKTDLLHGSLEEPLSTTIPESRPRYIIPSIYGDICHLEGRSDETGLPKRYMSQEKFCHWRTCRMNHKPESRGFKNALAKFYFVRRWSNWPACTLTCCLNVGCLAQTSCSAKSGLTASRRDVRERPTVEIRVCSLVLYYRFQNGSGIASWDRRQRKCHRSVHYPTKVPAGIQSDNNQTVRQLKWSPEDTYVAIKELTYTVQIKIRLLNETGMTLTYVYWRWSERPTIEMIPLPLRTAGDVETQRCS